MRHRPLPCCFRKLSTSLVGSRCASHRPLLLLPGAVPEHVLEAAALTEQRPHALALHSRASRGGETSRPGWSVLAGQACANPTRQWTTRAHTQHFKTCTLTTWYARMGLLPCTPPRLPSAAHLRVPQLRRHLVHHTHRLHGGREGAAAWWVYHTVCPSAASQIPPRRTTQCSLCNTITTPLACLQHSALKLGPPVLVNPGLVGRVWRACGREARDVLSE